MSLVRKYSIINPCTESLQGELKESFVNDTQAMIFKIKPWKK